MRKHDDIQRGGLSGKMSGFTPEPPPSAWENISGRIGGKNSRRTVMILLAAAASLALAVTVGVTLLKDARQPGTVVADDAGRLLQAPADSGSRESVEISSEGEPGDTRINDARAADAPADRDGEVVAGTESRKIIDRRGLKDQVAEAVREALPQGAAGDSVYYGALINNQSSGTREEVIPGEQPEGAEQPAVKPGGEQEGEVPGIPADTVTDRQATGGDEPAGRDEKPSAYNQALEDSLLRALTPEALPDAEEDRKERDNRWQLGASVSPLYNYRDAASADEAFNTLVNNVESARITYAGGVHVSYRGTDRLTVESGLFYTQMGVNIGGPGFWSGLSRNSLEYTDATEGVAAISNSMGSIVGEDKALYLAGGESGVDAVNGGLDGGVELVNAGEDVLVTDQYIQSFNYLEIPLNIRYSIIDRTVRVQLVGGVSTNLLVNNNIVVNTAEGRSVIGGSEDLRTMNYSGNAGVGVVYDLFDRFSLRVEPRFRYFLHSVNSSSLPSTRPYTFGVYTGINYLF